MADPHFNIFHAYRGSSESDVDSERQLEDNLTRALIVTLNTIRNSSARFDLLRALQIPEPSLERPYRCQLQVGKEDPDWPDRPRRRLLVVHGGPELRMTTTNSPAIRGRADATVAFSDFVVAIESKLGDEVAQGQLTRHFETLGIPDMMVEQITWSELAQAVRRMTRRYNREPIVHFVLGQFEEYLRMNGFGGLTADHFAYFAQPQENRDPLVKDGIRRVLMELGIATRNSLRTEWTLHGLNIDAGASDAGIVLWPAGGNSEPHLTMTIDPGGIHVFANVELARAYKRFTQAWRANPDGLIAELRQLGRTSVSGPGDIPWRFRVIHRVKLRPRKYHYWPAVDVSLNVLTRWKPEVVHEFIDNAIRPIDQEADPEITLGRLYPASLALNMTDLPHRLSADAKELAPYFEWLSSPMS